MRNRKYQSVASPEDHAPAHRRPGVWSSWEVTLWSKILCMHRVDKARNTRRSEKTDHFHVTLEARASCELASCPGQRAHSGGCYGVGRAGLCLTHHNHCLFIIILALHHRALRRMAGLVFLLVFWVLAWRDFSSCFHAGRGRHGKLH